MITVLVDEVTGVTSAVVISKVSTEADIYAAIERAKRAKDVWTYDDLIGALPEDCEITSRWTDKWGMVIY